MKNFKFLLIAIFIQCNIFAQDVFINGPLDNYGFLPNDGTEICYPNVVWNLFPSVLDTFYGVKQVYLDITHQNPTELQIRLVSAAGTSVDLAINNGSPYFPNFDSIYFDMNANLNVAGVTTGFNNLTLLPIENLGNFNDGQIGEGLWQLCIKDTETSSNSGVIHNWSITLDENENLPDVGFIQNPICNTNCTLGCQCADSTQQNCLLLPDVVISKNLMEMENFETEDTLRVTTATTNIGYGTIEFRSTGNWFCGTIPWIAGTLCDDGSQPKLQVDQRIYKKDGTNCIDYVDVTAGFMQHHSALGHNHPHINNWVQNSIRIMGRDSLNPASWPIVRLGSKISFCVENSLPCTPQLDFYCDYDGFNYTIDEDLVNSRMGQDYGCDNIIQGISVGYTDVYGYLLSGQEITDINNLCNGNYYLIGHFDPDSIFTEANKSNNVTVVPINLTKQQQNCCTTNFEEIVISANGCDFEFNDLTQPIPNSWLWDFGDGTTSTEQFPIHTYNTIGSYNVVLTTENDSSCNNTLARTINVNCNAVNIIEQQPVNFTYNVLPNPFENGTFLNLKLQKQSEIKIELYNILNQKVKVVEQNKILETGNHQIKIDVEETGVYVLNIIVNNKRAVKRIVKL